MEPYSIDSIITQAKVCLDENVSSDALASLGDVDTLTLEEIIQSKVEDAARLVHAGAALHLLDNGKALTTSVSWDSRAGYGSGHIMLPPDFLRLLTFKMSDWSHAVHEVITEDHPLYALQSSRYGGVRGNPQSPVVAIARGPNGLQLEFYGCETGNAAHVTQARYIPVPRIDRFTRDISMCQLLVRAVVYRTASLTALAIGAGDAAAALLATSNELAGIES